VLGGVRGTLTRFVAVDGLFLAAGLAFFFLVCLIPLLVLAVSTVGFVFSSPQVAQDIVAQIGINFPVYRREITRAMLRIVETRTVSGLLGTLTLIVFSMPLFSASRLVLHRLLGVKAGGHFVRNLAIDAVMVVTLAVLLFAATAFTAVVQWFETLLFDPEWLGTTWTQRTSIALSLLISGTMFFLGYRYLPRRHPRALAALGGAVVASVLWEIAKQLFALYIKRFGLYDQIYGPLGILVAFVMFVYYSAVVFVLGGAYVATIDSRRR
jgi:membrane protein